jgi:hypothetical protein
VSATCNRLLADAEAEDDRDDVSDHIFFSVSRVAR